MGTHLILWQSYRCQDPRGELAYIAETGRESRTHTHTLRDTCRGDYSFGHEPVCGGVWLSEWAILSFLMPYLSDWLYWNVVRP